MTPVTYEQSFLGFGLLIVGVAGISAAVLVRHDDVVTALALFAAGAVVSVLVRRHKGLDMDTLSSLQSPPAGSVRESSVRTASRPILVLIASGGFLALATIFGIGAAAAVGGLVAGQAIVELHLALLFFQWERNSEAILFSPSSGLFPHRRDAFPDLFSAMRTDHSR